MITIIFKD